MKKRILTITLAVIMLMNCTVFTSRVEASTFSDVPDTHWAIRYIDSMQYTNIINGYEDGTFKPEAEVKTGEFIKMVAMAYFPNYKYEAPSEGWHWSKPYVEILDHSILRAQEYNNERVERIITRAEAAEIICYYYMLSHSDNKENLTLERDEKYIKNFKDEALIIDKESRIFIDNCVRFGLINGFDDGTFKPENGLTRAQAAKLIYTVEYAE